MVDFNGHIGVIKKGENKGRDRQGLEKEHEIQKNEGENNTNESVLIPRPRYPCNVK